MRPKTTRALQAAEVLVALLPVVGLLALEPLREVAWAVIRAALLGAQSFFLLLPVDAAGTLLTGLITLVKIALLTAPIARAFALGERHRLAWLPLTAIFYLFALPMLFPAIASPWMWLLFVLATALGWWGAGRERLRALAFVPMLITFAPTLSHSPLSDRVWPSSRLAARCERNDGVRPLGFTPDKANTRYFDLTELGPDWLLLTGERQAWHLGRSDEGELFYARPAAMTGNTWVGSAAGPGELWFTKRYLAIHAQFRRPVRPEDAAHPYTAPWSHPYTNHLQIGGLATERRSFDDEDVDYIELPQLPGTPLETDFNYAIYDPDDDIVYMTQQDHGSLYVLRPSTGEVSRQVVSEFGAINLHLTRRDDGVLVGSESARVVVYDPRTDTLLDNPAAAISGIGMSYCPRDGRLAVSDFAGRLRVFAPDQDGHYALQVARLLRAPRRVQFSDDCELLGVGSGDDHTAWVLRADTLETLDRFSVGPALRHVRFVGPDQLGVVDACGLTVLSPRAGAGATWR